MSEKQKNTHPKSDTKDAFVVGLIAELEAKMQTFLEKEGVGSSLTATDRRRLVGAGVRNYGFIDKSFDIARDNPAFMPAHFDVDALIQNMHELEELRQLMFVLQQFTQAVSNAFLVQADSCYRDALRVYGSLKEQTRNRVPGAQQLFQALQTFFSKSRRHQADEPTVTELERDFNRLVHGKEDGEIVIKNESPHVSGGLHEVIDSVHKGKSAFKESTSGNIDEK